MNNTQFDITVLSHLFDPTVKDKIVTPIQPIKVQDNEKNMLGYSVINELETIHIDEVLFTKNMLDLASQMENALAIAKRKMTKIELESLASDNFKQSANALYYSYSYAEILKIGHSLKKQFEETTNLIKDVKNKIIEMNEILPKLKNVIDSNLDNSDPCIQTRVSMLQKVLAFQQLRIQSIENNIEASQLTLDNCANFLSFNFPSLTYNFQTKLVNVDLSTILLNFDEVFSNERMNFEKRNSVSAFIGAFLIGLAITVGLILFFITLESKGFPVVIVLIIGIVCLFGSIAAYFDKEQTVDKFGSMMMFSFGLGFTTFSFIHNFINNSFFENNISLLQSTGIITFIGAIISGLIAVIREYNFDKYLNQFTPLYKKLSNMEQEYKEKKID